MDSEKDKVDVEFGIIRHLLSEERGYYTKEYEKYLRGKGGDNAATIIFRYLELINTDKSREFTSLSVNNREIYQETLSARKKTRRLYEAMTMVGEGFAKDCRFTEEEQHRCRRQLDKILAMIEQSRINRQSLCKLLDAFIGKPLTPGLDSFFSQTDRETLTVIIENLIGACNLYSEDAEGCHYSVNETETTKTIRIESPAGYGQVTALYPLTKVLFASIKDGELLVGSIFDIHAIDACDSIDSSVEKTAVALYRMLKSINPFYGGFNPSLVL